MHDHIHIGNKSTGHRLSVIVPVFNCESYILRCLTSIDYPDSEIIVVDDGSTDNCVGVIAEFQNNHDNVKLIRKKNGGVSSARNIGIDASTGKYIMFVDADDYLVPGGISQIIDIAESKLADIVTYDNITKQAEDPIDIDSISDFDIQIKVIEGRAEALRTYHIPDYVVWRSLFLRSIIIDNNIRFDEDLHLREDDTFMGKFYCYTSRVVCTNLPLYRYIASSPCSSTHRQSKERNKILIESGLLAIKHRSEFIKKALPDEDFPYERLKYMRWVCSPRQAVEAGFILREYKDKLLEFNAIGGGVYGQ